MAPATAPRTALPDEELEKLVALIKDVDSIELKLTVPEPAQLSTARALGLDPLQAQIRQVFFLDTPELALDRHEGKPDRHGAVRHQHRDRAWHR